MKSETSADAGRLPDHAGRGRLLVCERAGCWAVGLRRELAGSRPVYETRSLAQCWEMLAGVAASFVVVELTGGNGGNTDALLERMGRLERDFPLARLAVVAGRDLGGYEWLMREAGAVHFVSSPRRLRPLADLACRHLDQVAEPQRSLTEQIWAGLPWGQAEL